MRITRRQLAAISLGTASLGVLATPRRARAAEALKFMTLAGHHYMPPLFAMDQGFFAAEGVQVDATIATAGPTILPGIVGGAIQFGSTSAIQVATAREAGLDIVVIAPANTQYRAHPNTALLVRKDSGISKPADLIGRKVVTPGTAGSFHVVFLKYLRQNGIDPARVTFLEGGFAQMGDMVRSGTADVALAVEPFLSRQVEAGNATRMEYFVSDRPYLFDSFFVASEAWVKAHRAETAAVQRGLRQAVAKMNADPALASAVEAKFLKLPPDVLAKTAAADYIAEVTPADLQFWIDLARESGMISKPMDAAQLIVT